MNKKDTLYPMRKTIKGIDRYFFIPPFWILAAKSIRFLSALRRYLLEKEYLSGMMQTRGIQGEGCS